MCSKNQKEVKCSVLTVSGILIIVFGIATCAFVVVGNSRNLVHLPWLERSCQLGMMMGTVIYCALRFSVYIFLIYRIDLVNLAPSKSVLIVAVKWMIVLCYLSGVAITLIFVRGKLEKGDVVSCRGRFKPIPIFICALTDFIICFIALKWFLRPLKNINRSFQAHDMSGDDLIFRLMKKMRFFGYIMILSTVVAICVNGIFGGMQFIYAIDSGITSFALVLIYEPNDHFFGDRQVTLPVVTTRDLHQLTVELKYTSPTSTVDIEKTLTSSDVGSVSSAHKIAEYDTNKDSSIFSGESEPESTARDNFVCERSGVKAGYELHVRGSKNHQKVPGNTQDPRSQMDCEQFVTDIEDEDSLEIIVEKSVIEANEDLGLPQSLTCGLK